MNLPGKCKSSALVEEEDLELTLGPKPLRQRKPEPAPLVSHSATATTPASARTYRPPYPWATSCHASIYSMDYLLAQGMKTISGTMRCIRCEAQSEVEYDLIEKFSNLLNFINKRYQDFYDRAPQEWMAQNYDDCNACGEASCVRPVLPENCAEINWLFLLLGQNLGWCTLDHLKYFCQHTKNHRTGTKDRVLYLTYKFLCQQLDATLQF